MPDTLTAALLPAATLAACGGGDLSWCIQGGSGSLSAGCHSADSPPDSQKNQPLPVS
ncbi:MAG: hypothetical protein LCH72_16160 [Proteobacteria bacterium]|nr:hypothetical protein [Burkholderiales bacterium]MCA0312193.1 hypothetical protein [Pseudomonadota bacterium]